jgi:hypothetical protein
VGGTRPVGGLLYRDSLYGHLESIDGLSKVKGNDLGIHVEVKVIKVRDGGVWDVHRRVLALIDGNESEAVGVSGNVVNAGRRHGEVKEVVLGR